MRRHHFTVTSLAVVLLVVAGCNSKAPAPNSEPTSAAPPASQTEMRDPGPLSGEWRWARTVTPAAVIVVDDPTRYTVAFADSGRLAVRADCNRGAGTFSQDGMLLVIGPFALTRMMCPPGSLDGTFVAQLGAVSACFMQGDTLMIDLQAAAGTMRFVRGS